MSWWRSWRTSLFGVNAAFSVPTLTTAEVVDEMLISLRDGGRGIRCANASHLLVLQSAGYINIDVQITEAGMLRLLELGELI